MADQNNRTITSRNSQLSLTEQNEKGISLLQGNKTTKNLEGLQSFFREKFREKFIECSKKIYLQ